MHLRHVQLHPGNAVLVELHQFFTHLGQIEQLRTCLIGVGHRLGPGAFLQLVIGMQAAVAKQVVNGLAAMAAEVMGIGDHMLFHAGFTTMKANSRGS